MAIDLYSVIDDSLHFTGTDMHLILCNMLGDELYSKLDHYNLFLDRMLYHSLQVITCNEYGCEVQTGLF